MKLGKMVKITDLRSVWKNEPRNFSKWLAEEENLNMLGKEIGVDMTLEQLESCRREAKRLCLAGWYELSDTAACLHECNGIGARWMGWFCKVLNFIFPSLVTASAIHDMRYFRHSGERDKWDDEFESNCRIILRDRYRKFNPVRYAGYYLVHKLRVALTIGGSIAWNISKENIK